MHTDPISSVLFWVTLIFLMSVLGRYLARACGQPGVLGELMIGVLFGNLCYAAHSQLMVILREGPFIYGMMQAMLQGKTLSQSIDVSAVSPHTAQLIYTALTGSSGAEYLKIAYILDIFSRYGVIFLLFLVGVESSLQELKQTGKASFCVAVLGVIAPLVLGFGVAHLLLPTLSFTADLFIGATLCATSVGVTARVLRELKRLHSREAQTILGAAMLDDILGLLILAMVSNMAIQGHVDVMQMLKIMLESCLFFVAILSIGPWILQKSMMTCRFFELWESKLIVSFLLVMIAAWLATLVNLAAIIGAFAAGLIIHDGYFKNEQQGYSKTIKDLVSPIEALLAPLFFMLIGIQVKLETFMDKEVLLISAGLVAAAVLGKLISGLVASKQDDRLLIGIGMMPRGEVGLIFASIGKTLGVLSDQLFSAVVLMVIVTTMLAPPLMKWRISSQLARSTP
ncbi:MAG: cation:proton antiporter [Gammaproteobacteria bacterium]|nr:cation:proton antiporter [Gammaproteobacteria bacterium]